MKKLITTATALMFALGLTVAGQAQTAAEKPKNDPVPVQKVTTATPEAAKDQAKPEAPKVTAAEAQKADKMAPAKKQEAQKGKKDKDAAAKVEKQTGKEVKTTAVPEKKPGEVKTTAAPGKKPGVETPKTDKQ